jgi:hypothetical protein
VPQREGFFLPDRRIVWIDSSLFGHHDRRSVAGKYAERIGLFFGDATFDASGHLYTGVM